MSRIHPAVGLLFGLMNLLPAAPGRGQDWTVVPLGTSADILAVENTSFPEKWIVGTGGFVAQSSLDRTAWTTVNAGTNADLLSVHQPSFGQVWVGAGAGTVRLKPQWWLDWESRNVPGVTEDFVLFSRSSGGSYAVGSAGGIYHTSDLGVNWTAQSSGTTAALHGGSGFTSATAYVVGAAGTILMTTSGGMVWSPLASGTAADLYGVEAVTNSEYLVCGAGGLLLRTTNGGGPCYGPAGAAPLPNVGSGYRLTELAPNPLSGAGTLELEVAFAQDVRSELVDTAGRRVATLFGGRVEPGSRLELNLDARHRASGIYFLRVIGETFAASRRIVVAH